MIALYNYHNPRMNSQNSNSPPFNDCKSLSFSTDLLFDEASMPEHFIKRSLYAKEMFALIASMLSRLTQFLLLVPQSIS